MCQVQTNRKYRQFQNLKLRIHSGISVAVHVKHMFIYLNKIVLLLISFTCSTYGVN